MLKRLSLLLLLLFFVPLSVVAAWSVASGWPQSWHTADWSSAGLAPDPSVEKQPVIQVYAARAGRWKGVFSVHTWIVFKQEDEKHFTRYDVVGWGTPLRLNSRPVDGRWYGNTPDIIFELEGERAGRLIPKVQQAIRDYPYAHRGGYRVWPGPNSNSFVAWIGRQVPELGLEMPANALGKDYLGDGVTMSTTPSGSGWQFSLWGAFGLAVGVREGIELHLMGATLGLDFDDLGLKLPGMGTLSVVQMFSS